MAVTEEDDEDFYRRYGPWDAVDLGGAAELMNGFGAPWWIAGGYAIEAFTGEPRIHEDCDIAIFARDVDRLRLYLEDRFHTWSVGSGALRPLDSRFPELPEWAGQVWIREHALAPWKADIVITPDVDGRWQSRRDEGHVADLDDVTWLDGAGLRFLNPEIAMLFKARLDRSKDRVDLDRTWPKLSVRQQGWLRDAVGRLYPKHPWRERLERD